MKQYTIEQVSLHNTENDSWVVINGNVYDVTRYHTDHPGGQEVILDVLGRDATTYFEDVGHSEDAVLILSKYVIGTIATDSPGSATDSPGSAIPVKNNKPNPNILTRHGKLNLVTKIVLVVSGGLAIGGIVWLVSKAK